jgi:CubicO group peptidase (beta-lactamase class C family)
MKIKHSKVYPLFIASILLFQACSQKNTHTLTQVDHPKQIGIKEKNLERVDSLLGTALVNQWAAGVSVLLAKDGKIFYQKAFGFKDRENKALLKSIDEFRIASMSKPIVSLAALSLAEQGKINLDDKVSKYLPEFQQVKVLKDFNSKDTTFTSVNANYEITIKQLLNETSGFGGGIGDTPLSIINQKNNIPNFTTSDKLTIQETVKKMAKLPLAVQPNQRYEDGLSADVLGAILEVATGLTLDSVLRKTILVPAGMMSTHFYLPTTKLNRLAVMYSETANGKLERTPNKIDGIDINYPIIGAKTYFSGAHGLVTTTEDYAKFLQLILNKGFFNNKQIVSEKTIELFTSNQIGSLYAGNNKYGYGIAITTVDGVKNKASVGKWSGQGIFNTYFWIDPKRNSLAVLFTQVYPSVNGNALFDNFEKIVNEIIDDKIIK